MVISDASSIWWLYHLTILVAESGEAEVRRVDGDIYISIQRL